MKNIIITNEKKGILYACTSGICYGLTGFIGVELMNAGLSSATILFWRFLISSLFLMLMLGLKYKAIQNTNSTKNASLIILYGMIFYGTSALAYFSSINKVGNSIANVLLYTYPTIILAINVVVYKNKVKYSYYLAILIIIIGIGLINDVNNINLNIIGIALGLASSILYALYVISTRKIMINALFSTFMVSIGCTIVCFITTIFESNFDTLNNLYHIINLLFLGVFCTSLPMLFLLKSLEYINPIKASILSILEPLFVITFSIIFLNENITLTQFIGILIVLLVSFFTLLL